MPKETEAMGAKVYTDSENPETEFLITSRSTRITRSLSLLAGGSGPGSPQSSTPELGCGGERLMLRDGEHQQKAFSASEVVVTDGRIVLLAGCVQDVYLNFFPVENHLLPVTVSFGGLIVFYKLGKQ